MRKGFHSILSSVRIKLLFSLFILALLMAVLIIFTSYTVNSNIARRRVSESFSLALDQVYTSVDSELNQIRNLSSYFFSSTMIKNVINLSTTNSPESKTLNAELYDMIWQYSLTHIFNTINGIALVGYNGYEFSYALDYTDLPSSYIPLDDSEWRSLPVRATAVLSGWV